MKKLLFLFAAIILIAAACTKSGKSTSTTSYSYTGTITGPDLTMTPCSGGYLISISGISTPSRFNTLPAGSGIDLTTATFPINVTLNWHHPSGDPSPCNIIIIDAIAKD